MQILINDEIELVAEIPYPNIPEGTKVTEFSFFTGFVGTVQSFCFFAEPLEKELVKAYFSRLRRGIQQDTDLGIFQETFRIPINSLSCLGTALFPNSCPFTLRKFEIAPRVNICRRERISLAAVIHKIAILAQKASSTESLDTVTSLLTYILEALRLDPSIEAELLERNLVLHIRAIVEAAGLVLTERPTKLILNIVRTSQSEFLTATVLANLVFSNLMRSGFTVDSKNLCLEFIGVYFPQLSALQPFQNLLAKRLLLIHVHQIKELLAKNTDWMIIRDEAFEPFLFFCRKTIRRLSIDESAAFLEAVIWGVFGENSPILQKLFLSLISVDALKSDLS